MLEKIKQLINGRKIEERIIRENPFFKNKNIQEIEFIPIDDDVDRMKFYGCYAGDKYIYQNEAVIVKEDQRPKIKHMIPAELKTDDILLAYERKEIMKKGRRRMFLGKVKAGDEILVNEKKFDSFEKVLQEIPFYNQENEEV